MPATPVLPAVNTWPMVAVPEIVAVEIAGVDQVVIELEAAEAAEVPAALVAVMVKV